MTNRRRLRKLPDLLLRSIMQYRVLRKSVEFVNANARTRDKNNHDARPSFSCSSVPNIGRGLSIGAS